MDIEKIKIKLENVITPQRFIHSLNVMHTAVKLASFYCEDKDKIRIAGLIHDCARDIPDEQILNLCETYEVETDPIYRRQPKLLHGPLGSVLARTEFDIKDETVLHAIKCHTTGTENMSMIDKILFVADYIEPDRSFPGVNEVRRLAFKNINKALLLSLDRTIKFIVTKGGLIHPETINARNDILLKKTSGTRKKYDRYGDNFYNVKPLGR